jgi:hypothetical protein
MESFQWMMAVCPLIAHNDDTICPQKDLNEGICVLHTSIALHLCCRVCLKSQITKKSYLYKRLLPPPLPTLCAPANSGIPLADSTPNMYA